MSTLNERIKKVRKAFDLTQREFGERIAMKQNSVAQVEMGRSTSEQTIFSICREFNVNETWLRTGEGEMFVPMSRDDQITDFMADVLKNEDESFKRRFIAALSKLDESEWEVLEKIALDLVDGSKKD